MFQRTKGMQPDVITTHGYLFNIRALTRISFHDVRANLHAIRATFSSVILETDQDNTTHQRAVEIYIFFFQAIVSNNPSSSNDQQLSFYAVLFTREKFLA